jgi:glycosyltransferase involved in cell wall biosynthesis
MSMDAMKKDPTTMSAKALLIIREQGFASFLLRALRFVQAQVHRSTLSGQKLICRSKMQPKWPAGTPLVSVIIPCYNYGHFLRGAIESVLAQTFQRFEILVVDDGSTDELTRQVLRELSHEKTRVIHQRNQGLAETRNNGAAAAAGKYICFLDPDDFFEPAYLEKTLAILESDETLGCCYSWVRCFGDWDSIWKTEDLDPFFLRMRDTAPAHSVIRKQAWERVRQENGSGFLTKYNGYFEDWVFWIDMLHCGYRGKVIKEPLIRYRVHKNSLSATHRPNYEQMLKVLHEDRQRFFHDRKYRRQLEANLRRRAYVINHRVNLDSAKSDKSAGLLLSPPTRASQSRQPSSP